MKLAARSLTRQFNNSIKNTARLSPASSSSSSSASSSRAFAMSGSRQFSNASTRTPTFSTSSTTYEGQPSLPHLPVPPLEQTLNKYLRTTLPHHTSDASLKATEQAVQAALSGKDAALLKTLQQRLQERAHSTDSWLSEWWNSAAYMAYRDPVVPYVSYFYAHKDDLRSRTAPKRAAELLKGFMAFRRLVEAEKIAPEKTKNGPLCMASYPWIFNSCRIPEKPEDYSVKYDAKKNNHVVVARNGFFFSFDLLHPDGAELTAKEIEAQIAKIQADPSAASPNALPVGALTSDNRDAWTDARAKLLAVGKQNADSLAKIESAVVVLALESEPSYTLEETAWQLWYGNGQNRFYDKQQIIVFPNGKSGFMGEHSMIDGTPTLRLNDFVLNALAANKIDLGGDGKSGSELPAPEPISFALDAGVESAIAQSIKAFDELKAAHDLAILDYQGYGKNAIKKFKCSPDAWAQMVIQLAYYRLSGRTEVAPTYESAQTRKFKLGRTEVIRSASVESKKFVELMEDASASDEDRSTAFQAAVKSHLGYAKQAADGHGVDRHLFGLKRLLQPGEELPEIYKDPMFARSSTWVLSTSQISSEVFDSWGYGEVTPEGYGTAYAIKNESLTFCVTSKGRNSARLRHFLNESARDLRDLHLRLAAKSEIAAPPKL
ncbi:Carnitine O-acetyltransferase mitochondrial [Tilletia horrida]|nr:Carnitine O-acetyltransferase mitochondrial [Tilletia horrida]KAK0559418.1 Carnitine O-acetyltransferase mitochondrial [Tilletia horrida]